MDPVQTTAADFDLYAGPDRGADPAQGALFRHDRYAQKLDGSLKSAEGLRATAAVKSGRNTTKNSTSSRRWKMKFNAETAVFQHDFKRRSKVIGIYADFNCRKERRTRWAICWSIG